MTGTSKHWQAKDRHHKPAVSVLWFPALKEVSLVSLQEVEREGCEEKTHHPNPSALLEVGILTHLKRPKNLFSQCYHTGCRAESAAFSHASHDPLRDETLRSSLKYSDRWLCQAE
eukprot:4969401-Amphidinium_carterae.1